MVRDADGHDLSGRAIHWSSDNSSMATIRVFARGQGTVRITATAEGVTGNADARIEEPPVIVIPSAMVLFTANRRNARGAVEPDDSQRRRRHSRCLVAGGSYPPAGATGWLDASLSTPRAPSEATLTVNPAGLPPGVYTSNVTVSLANARPRERSVEVRLEIRDPDVRARIGGRAGDDRHAHDRHVQRNDFRCHRRRRRIHRRPPC